MSTYRVHTLASAPDPSRPALHDLNEAFGIIPNVAGIMATSPPLLQSFVGTFHPFHGGTLTAAQRQVLLLSTAVENACAWAVAFHSTLAVREGERCAVAEQGRRLLHAEARHSAPILRRPA